MKRKKAGIFTKLIVLVLLVYAAATLVKLRGQIEEANAAKAEIQAKVDKRESENNELQYAIDHYEDLDTVEKVARDELGFGKPGEIVIMEEGQ